MSRAPLHLADSPPPDRLYNTTYCGRVLDEVIYWATPECADNAFSGWRRCAVCARALARRHRGPQADSQGGSMMRGSRRHCEATTRRGYCCTRPATAAFSLDTDASWALNGVITEHYCTYHGIWWAEEYRRRAYPGMRALGHPRVVAAFGAPKVDATVEEAA